METQRFSTPSPISSIKSVSHDGIHKTPPNTRIMYPPGAPRQCRFFRLEVGPQSSRLSRALRSIVNGSNCRYNSPTLHRGHYSRDTRSRSPPRDRDHAYRSRSPVNSHLFDRPSSREALLGPMLTELTGQRTVMDNAKFSGSCDMNGRWQEVLSLADNKHKEQATGKKLPGLPSNRDTREKSKENDASSSEKQFKDSSDNEHDFSSKKHSK